MKNSLVLLAATIGIGLLSCNHNNSTVAPAAQNSLALVIANSNNAIATNNLLLLKDGRIADPVSGIPNFEALSIGSKLSLTFTAGVTNNGVLNVNVTQYASAQDSVFATNPPPTNDTTSFSGTFTGIAYTAILPDSVSTAQKATISISFNGTHYSCSGVTDGYPQAGSGTFVTSSGASITFSDQSTNSDTVLNGLFYYSLSQGHLNLWITRNNTFYCYSLARE